MFSAAAARVAEVRKHNVLACEEASSLVSGSHRLPTAVLLPNSLAGTFKGMPKTADVVAQTLRVTCP